MSRAACFGLSSPAHMNRWTATNGTNAKRIVWKRSDIIANAAIKPYIFDICLHRSAWSVVGCREIRYDSLSQHWSIRSDFIYKVDRLYHFNIEQSIGRIIRNNNLFLINEKKTEWVRNSIRTNVPARTRKRDRHGERKTSSFPFEWILWIKKIEMHFRPFYCIRRLARSMSVIFLIHFNCGVAYVWVKHKQAEKLKNSPYKITVADFSHFNLYFTLELVLLLKICIRRCYRIRPWSQLLFFSVFHRTK